MAWSHFQSLDQTVCVWMSIVVIHDISGVSSVQLEPQRGQREVTANWSMLTAAGLTLFACAAKLPNKTTHLISSLSLSSSLGSHISCSRTTLVGIACFQWFIDYWYELSLSLAPFLTFEVCLSPSVRLCVSLCLSLGSHRNWCMTSTVGKALFLLKL